MTPKQTDTFQPLDAARDAARRLPGKIKVRLSYYDNLQLLVLTPISPRVRRLIERTQLLSEPNAEIAIQGYDDILWFIFSYPRAVFRPIFREGADFSWQSRSGRTVYRCVNDGAVLLIDSWEFRHMCGGQID